MRLVTFFTLAGLLVASTARADEPDRLKDATLTLQEMGGAGDKGIPQDLVSKAVCAVMVPGMKKAPSSSAEVRSRLRFVPHRHRLERAAGVRVEGGSVGIQIGGSSRT